MHRDQCRRPALPPPPIELGFDPIMIGLGNISRSRASFSAFAQTDVSRDRGKLAADVPGDVARQFAFRNAEPAERAREGIARVIDHVRGGERPFSLCTVIGAGSSAANRLYGVPFIGVRVP